MNRLILPDGDAARLAAPVRRGKLASVFSPRHKRDMRLIVLAGVMLLAGCAPRPAPVTGPIPAVSTSPATSQHDHRALNGMTAGELIQHFGRPRLQIVE